MIGLADALANAEADNVTSKVDAGGAAGSLKVYDGDRPDTPATAATGNLLATFTLPYPSAAAASGGIASWNFATAPSTTVSVTGTPSWFRVADSTGAAVFDGDVGVTGADLNFDSLVWVAGEGVSLPSGSTQAG